MKQYVATQLSIPESRVSPKPYGSQWAQWESAVDGNGKIVLKPRDTDRMVKAFFNVDDAWKVFRAKK